MNWQTALRIIHKTFQDAGVFYALGGSAMLCLRGIASDAHDLDLFVLIEDAPRAAGLLCSIGEQNNLPLKPEYRTAHFSHYHVNGVDVDLMADFAVSIHWGTVDYPSSVLIAEGLPFEGATIPCMMAEDWLFLYEVLGRTQRVLQLESYFDTHPANQERLIRLLALPMPEEAINRLEKQLSKHSD
jgi:hypothetical protein